MGKRGITSTHPCSSLSLSLPCTRARARALRAPTPLCAAEASRSLSVIALSLLSPALPPAPSTRLTLPACLALPLSRTSSLAPPRPRSSLRRCPPLSLPCDLRLPPTPALLPLPLPPPLYYLHHNTKVAQTRCLARTSHQAASLPQRGGLIPSSLSHRCLLLCCLEAPQLITTHKPFSSPLLPCSPGGVA